ncbi:hypothetical protein [Acinetobacter haemolyticus]|uniref:Uncharacterized protein n=1 Tax=Acinetobacter haemolyticus CIP 64.3 = MTCC 9819 TaxID=1217659 RepID=N9F849_ACIHA|nr:hypothetical protein [Acinetobacter haemolyticus]ENW18752.1 hypothetical protein F927_01218 [Acinetobacter haemolyticus CIP 64.3 = MTCC 9819]SPT46691.1 Uncharacterised protein [Acinetobacter haemolyticus]SUU59508.1 Uncharacterised protein [Acinetobacter haemolyticus]
MLRGKQLDEVIEQELQMMLVEGLNRTGFVGDFLFKLGHLT